jgi:small GTP-binding protein
MLGTSVGRTIQELISLQAFAKTSSYIKEATTSPLYNLLNVFNQNFSSVATDAHHGDHELQYTMPPPPPSSSLPADQQLLVEVGVLGVPNAGKSTLTNALAGSKVSAVSDKTNTTTRSRLGAFTAGPTQVVMFDTPGIVAPGQNLSPRHLRRVESAWKTASECDVLLFVIDAQRQLALPDPRVLRLVQSLSGGMIPGLGSKMTLPVTALVLNKVDMVPKEQRSMMLPLAENLSKQANFDEVFWVSALRGHGVEELKEYLLQVQGKSKGWIVPSEANTDAGLLDLACEIVREKIFRAYYKGELKKLFFFLENVSAIPVASCKRRIELHLFLATLELNIC